MELEKHKSVLAVSNSRLGPVRKHRIAEKQHALPSNVANWPRIMRVIGPSRFLTGVRASSWSEGYHRTRNGNSMRKRGMQLSPIQPCLRFGLPGMGLPAVSAETFCQDEHDLQDVARHPVDYCSTVGNRCSLGGRGVVAQAIETAENKANEIAADSAEPRKRGNPGVCYG